MEKNLPVINVVTTSVGYTIDKIGVLPRVSNILSMAAFGANILKKWEYSLFKKYLESQGNISYTREKLIQIADEAYNQPKLVVKGACKYGSDSHLTIETRLTTGEIVPIPEQDYASAQVMMQSIDKFFKDFGITKEDTFACEQFIYSTIYGYAGTIDYIMKKNGFLHILDWKTSSHISHKYPLQIAAYIMALEERLKEWNINEKIAGATIVKFDKKVPGYELFCFTREEAERYFTLFLNCLNLYNYENSDMRSFKLF